MSAQLKPKAPKSAWLSWFAAPAQPNGWRVIRFKEVDAEGKPVGKPVESKSPAMKTRTFSTEASAHRAAQWLNLESH